MEKTVIVLLSAHFIADFVLQPGWLQRRKSQVVWANLLHGGMVAALSWLLIQQWTAWPVVLSVFIAHVLIDAVKQCSGDSWRAFCIDQSAHIGSLFLILWLFGPWINPNRIVGINWMVLAAGFALAVQGSGFLVGKVTSKLLSDNPGLQEKIQGLKNGGRLIGLLERAMIFMLILVGYPAGIGFLVAAKSILRFGETREDQQLAEYVLIGTLLSFGLAIATASLTLRALDMVATGQ
jgi:hypothetical protein